MSVIPDFFQLKDIFPSLLLYTEMHYRFRLTGSRYFKQEPDILADVPHRIEPNQPIPVLLLVKDADLYPIELKSAVVTLSQGETELQKVNHKLSLSLDQHWWHEVLMIPRRDQSGNLHINVELEYLSKGRIRSCINHNLKLLKAVPFSVFLADEPLPGEEEVVWGDLHYHSNYTEDMVEFGAPLEATRAAGHAAGLKFIAITDHSYDLDDESGSWKKTDPDLKRWKASRQEITHLNAEPDKTCLLIPAEEVTLHNHRGRNIHALVLNHPEFLPGQGDSAERPFDFSCRYTTRSLPKVLSKAALCIAAHPRIPVPFFEWLLIKRGQWHREDMDEVGLQLLNGRVDRGFWLGVKFWVRRLLEGQKRYIYAGNDAHGNFNYFRQIKTPMLILHEKREQLLGVCRTGVFSIGQMDIDSLLTALKKGQCIISNGPYLNLTVEFAGEGAGIGGSLLLDQSGQVVRLQIAAKSSVEFGFFTKMKVICGIPGDGELIIYEGLPHNDLLKMEQNFEQTVTAACYYRAEIYTRSHQGELIAFTNPIWISLDV